MTASTEWMALAKRARKATPGPYLWGIRRMASEPLGTLYGEGGDRMICDFGDAAEYYPSEGEMPSLEDQSHLYNCDPEFITALIKELKRLRPKGNV